ncbi:hypothetical protein ACNQFZ_20075 [Schinkia sp. CFF1]
MSLAIMLTVIIPASVVVGLFIDNIADNQYGFKRRWLQRFRIFYDAVVDALLFLNRHH